ncbi:MAG: radical SAM protein [Elusimicrobia bacterium]|nr:radical SAM protein [Elusimicrobiota bacterium]
MNLKKNNILNGLSAILQSKINRIYNKPIKPKVIAYSVTWRCNAKCPMCGLQSMDNTLKDPSQELNAEEIAKAFSDKALNSLDLIRFTGGEPFLKNDFTEIVDAIRKNADPKIFYITTNGSFPGKIRDFLEFFKNKNINLNIQVSFDAPNKLNDKIRGIPGLYNKVIETLEILKKAKESMPSLIAGVNQTITRENLNEINPMNKLMKKLELEHKIYIAVSSHESTILSGLRKSFEYKLASDLSEAEIIKLYSEIFNISNTKAKPKGITDVNYLWHLVEKFLWEGSKNRILKQGKITSIPCQAAFLYFRLMPNGDVVPCTLKPVVLGNIKKESFSDFWYSKKSDEFRKREVKACSGCWVECDIVSNFVYSPSILKSFLGSLLFGKH